MKEKLNIKVTSEQIYKKKIVTRFVTLGVATLLFVLSILYVMLYIVNQTGNFTISLDQNLKTNKHIIMSNHADFSDSNSILKINSLKYMDNITENWIPEMAISAEGNQSGEDYLAYTFFIKNNGEKEINYYREIRIQSVIKNVDEAIRVAVYLNGEKKTYAKIAKDGMPEPNTISFTSNHQVLMESRSDFQPGDVDKYTVVIWLEGEDPECVDNIKGGEMKMVMLIHENIEET